MAKFRKIHTAFWDDPLMEKISPDARYFYLFLMTNPLCTECGIYQITIKKMCNYTGYNEDSIKSLIRTFEIENSRIVYDFKTEEMCILKKANYIENTGKPVQDCLMSEFTNVKNKNLILRQIVHIEKENVRNIYESWYATSYGTTYDPSNKLGQEEEEEKEEKKNIPLHCEKIFNAQDEIFKNQIEFERICIATGQKNFELARESLRKFHLHLESNAKYPQTKRQIFAGFEKWLMNEKKFSNGTHQQVSPNGHQQHRKNSGVGDSRTDALEKF